MVDLKKKKMANGVYYDIQHLVIQEGLRVNKVDEMVNTVNHCNKKDTPCLYLLYLYTLSCNQLQIYNVIPLITHRVYQAKFHMISSYSIALGDRPLTKGNLHNDIACRCVSLPAYNKHHHRGFPFITCPRLSSSFSFQGGLISCVFVFLSIFIIA